MADEEREMNGGVRPLAAGALARHNSGTFGVASSPGDRAPARHKKLSQRVVNVVRRQKEQNLAARFVQQRGFEPPIWR